VIAQIYGFSLGSDRKEQAVRKVGRGLSTEHSVPDPDQDILDLFGILIGIE
jgi:hypothetical protein